ncbi:MAG: chorismate synthase [Pirellulales bacterium]
MRDESELYTLDPDRDEEIKKLIDITGKEGDTLGGIVEVRVEGLPFGLGTHAQWDRKLDGRLAQAVMAVQAIKGVEIGLGFEAAQSPRLAGARSDSLRRVARRRPHLGYIRPTNNAGGLEAGMTNGQPLVIRAAKKPISTLRKPLGSINMRDQGTGSGELRTERRLRDFGRGRDRGERRGVRNRRRAGRKIRRRQPARNAGPLRAVQQNGSRTIRRFQRQVFWMRDRL